MVKIENWAYIKTKIVWDKEQKRYKTINDSLAQEFTTKLIHVCGMVNGKPFVSNNGIDFFGEDRVTLMSGEVFYLGEINPYYAAFKNAAKDGFTILTEPELNRGLTGEYQLKANTPNKNIEFKKVVGQDKNYLLYFADGSSAFVDWTNAKFDDSIKRYSVECGGVCLIPIFEF